MICPLAYYIECPYEGLHVPSAHGDVLLDNRELCPHVNHECYEEE